MKIHDFFKVKKVRCVKGYDDCLEIGKEYNVIDVSVEIKVKDDRGELLYWESDYFEPVIDELSKSAENPLQDMKLTPEFETEASEPKFKVGDKVYIPNIKNLCTIRNDGKVITSDGQYYCNLSDSHDLCFVLATPENYEMLCKLYPHIEFEAPPKPLTGIELAKKLIAKGHNYLVVDTVIGIRVLTRLEGNTLIDSNNVRLDELDDITPLDDETGEPLTESILND